MHVTRIRRRIIIGFLFVAALPLVLFAAALVYPFVENRLRSRSFKAAVWRLEPTKDTNPWPTRLRMVDDLLASHHLTGLGRTDVLELLGHPDDVNFFRETSRRSDDADWDLGYKLGPERGTLMRIDNEWLLLDLDQRGRVRRVLVTHD